MLAAQLEPIFPDPPSYGRCDIELPSPTPRAWGTRRAYSNDNPMWSRLPPPKPAKPPQVEVPLDSA